MDSVMLAAAAGAIVAGFVQGLTGFGFALTAMTIWVWLLDPMLAAVLGVCGSLTGQLVGVFTVRRGLELRRLWPFLAGGAAGIPVGTAILPALDVPLLKSILGAVLVVWCPLMLLAPHLPRIGAGGRLADAIAGGLGGLMGGIGGFSGVLPTLWCTLRGFAKDEQRAVIQNFNLAALLVIMVLYLATGIVTWAMAPVMAVVALCVLVPAIVGARLYAGLSETRFRQLVLALLTLSGVSMLVTSLPQLMER